MDLRQDPVHFLRNHVRAGSAGRAADLVGLGALHADRQPLLDGLRVGVPAGAYIAVEDRHPTLNDADRREGGADVDHAELRAAVRVAPTAGPTPPLALVVPASSAQAVIALSAPRARGKRESAEPDRRTAW